MSLTVPNTAKAILIGASQFPKDDSLVSLPLALANIDRIAEAISQPNILGVPLNNITKLANTEDNVQILEDISSISEQAKGALIVYVTGHLVTRKGHLYLATPHSSRKKIHINGIALDELMDIISETSAETKIILFDVCYSTSNEEDVDASMVEDALKYYESAYSHTYIMASAPTASMDGFNGSQRTSTFTFALLDVLENGMEEEQEDISLTDLHKAMKSKLDGQHTLKSSSTTAEKVKIAYNTKFVEFTELRSQADQLFESQNFQQALTNYKKAGKLFEKNKEVRKRKEFIKLLIQGEEAFSKTKYSDAKQAFESAKELFEFDVVQNKINDTTLTIANNYFKKESYDLAREHYKEVLLELPNNEFVRERIEKCDHELRFIDLIDEADKLYFKDEFEEAKKMYEEALEIHSDRRALQRLEECEKLIHKASLIRAKIREEQSEKVAGLSEAELEKREKALEEKLRVEIEKDLRNKLQAELSPQLKEELQAEMRQNMENDFAKTIWSNVSLANNIDVYDFYLQFYPNPKYVAKAQKRLDELQTKHEAQAQKVADSIKKAASQFSNLQKEEEEITEKTKDEDNIEEVEAVDSRPETPDDILKMLEDSNSQKKHKPFMTEEKGDSHVNSDKPHGVLEDIEAQFGKEETEEKEEAKNTEEPEEITPTEAEILEIEASEIETPKVEEPKVEKVKEVEEQVIQREPTPEEIERSESMSRLEQRFREIEKEHEHDAPKEESNSSNEVEQEESYVKVERVEEPKADNSHTKVIEKEELTESVKEEEKVVEQPSRTSNDSSTTPLGMSLSESEELTEDALWQKVTETNTVESYKFYVDNTQESEHLVDAYYQINRLSKLTQASEEEEDDNSGTVSLETEDEENNHKVNGSSNGHSTDSYEYASYNYNGNSSETETEKQEVEVEVEEKEPEAVDTEDQSLWEKASSHDTVNAYYEYVANSKAKMHLEEAKKRINELKENAQNSEQDDWQNAEIANTIDGYKLYIKKYPLGNYYAKAMFRISELEAQH